MSLEHKIPLLITALLAVLLSLTVALSYQEVRSSAAVAGMQRLEGLCGDLADILEGALTSRLETVREVASDPSIRLFLQTGDDDYLREVDSVLSGLVSAAAPLPVRLLSPTGEVLHTFDPGSLAITGGSLPTEGQFGPLFEENGNTYYHELVRIEAGGRVIGQIAELRRFGSPQTAEQIANLTGSDASVFLADAGATWAGLDGSARPAPVENLPSGPLQYTVSGLGDRIGHGVLIEGTPWSLVVELPRASILARPEAFLRRVSLLLVVMIIVGAVGAWMLSRSFTKPMKRLSQAANSVAAGDYSERVELNRSDELGTLAATFNVMSSEVQRAQSSLHSQVDQATRLASDLEKANALLQELMKEAETARQTAEDASLAKSNFLATVSHELRTPINAIIGYTDLLLLEIGGNLVPAQMKQLERVQSNGRHLVRLIDDILDLAKIEAGHLEVERARGVVEQAVEAAVSMNELQASAKGVTLVRSWDPEAETIYSGDPGRVEQILVNLVSNAVKFTPSGGTVTVACGQCPEGSGRQRDERVFVSVGDNGIGIPPEKQELIFHRFVQAESGYKRAHEGAGLGLAISRELARMMGGDITVESAEGTGACFTLHLQPEVSHEREGTAHFTTTNSV